MEVLSKRPEVFCVDLEKDVRRGQFVTPFYFTTLFVRIVEKTKLKLFC